MKITKHNILFLFIILGIGLYMSSDKINSQSKDVKLSRLESLVSEPKLYGKLCQLHIEISAKSAKNTDNKVFLEEISARLYGDNESILAYFTTQDGIFNIKSKVLLINQKLLLNSEKFKLESESCDISIDDNLIIFYKPKIEIL